MFLIPDSENKKYRIERRAFANDELHRGESHGHKMDTAKETVKNIDGRRSIGEIRFSEVDEEKAYSAAARIVTEIEKVIIGKHREVLLVVTALLAGTHVLIEDVPGVGKTTIASTLASVTGLNFRRAQFTPDVTASDITGFNIYNKRDEEFKFTPGLVMTNIMLADEINRASPKTQSALLEAMEEGKVTVDGETYILPQPFMVIATQNPAGYVGTFPLPEAQLDRFGIRISMGYPTLDEEIGIVDNRRGNHIEGIKTASNASLVKLLQQLVSDVRVDPEICRYLVTLIAATREHAAVSLGASPRASIALKRLCQAYAFMNRRNYVVPEDVSHMFAPAAAHRLVLKREARQRGISTESVTADILSSVSIPYRGAR